MSQPGASPETLAAPSAVPVLNTKVNHGAAALLAWKRYWMARETQGMSATVPASVQAKVTACGICTHGAVGGESLNPDGTCPVAAIATVANEEQARQRVREEIDRMTRVRGRAS